LNKIFGGVAVLVIAVIVVMAGLTIVLLTLGKDPAATLTRFLTGALGTEQARADVIMAALPLLLCAISIERHLEGQHLPADRTL
jgi:ABC-type uncharacterized transport system permease subunit